MVLFKLTTLIQGKSELSGLFMKLFVVNDNNNMPEYRISLKQIKLTVHKKKKASNTDALSAVSRK